MRSLFVAVMAIATVGEPLMADAAPISFRELLKRDRESPTAVVPYGSGRRQFAELWLPKGEGPYPTLVLIHGGCWLAELPGAEQTAYLAKDLRDHGYAVWNVDYRRIGDEGGGYPGTFLDTAMAIDKLREIAPARKLDLRKLVAIGHSAGGHLATWAAARPHLPRASPLAQANPVPISGVVSLAGINDLAAYRDRGPDACGGAPTIDALIGAQERPGAAVYADTSPAALLPIGVKQIVVSGTLDPIVPAQFGKDYAKAAMAKGDTVKEMTLGDTGHFEFIDPQSQAWVKIRAEIDKLAK